MHGAARRIRPKFMTVFTTLLGLVPIMWATGTGSDVMKRIAAPMIGGIVTSFLLELVVYPALYEVWKSRGLPGRAQENARGSRLALEGTAGLTGRLAPEPTPK